MPRSRCDLSLSLSRCPSLWLCGHVLRVAAEAALGGKLCSVGVLPGPCPPHPISEAGQGRATWEPGVHPPGPGQAGVSDPCALGGVRAVRLAFLQAQRSVK